MEKLRFTPATAARWPLVERLFAGCGDPRKCWCAYWYRPNRDYRAGEGEGNRRFLQALVEGGTEPGVLALAGGEPVGWCGLAPRAAQDRLRPGRSRVLAAVDEQPVRSITCFVIAKDWRRRGLMRRLIAAAVDHARGQGAQLIEAYPIDREGRCASWELYTGTLSAFRDQGFAEVARRSPHRPIVRLEVAEP